MKTSISVSFLLMLFALSFPLLAAEPYTPVHPDPVEEPYRWRTFAELKGRGVQCVAEDGEGNIWFGVDEGVVRYDGTNWTTFTPADGLVGAPVTVLRATRKGALYAGSAAGLSRFQDGRWERVFPVENTAAWAVLDILETQEGAVWIGTPHGAIRLDRAEKLVLTGGQNGEFPALQKRTEGVEASRDTCAVYDLFEDREGRMWLGLNPDGRIVRLNAGRDRVEVFFGAGQTTNYDPRITQDPGGAIRVVSGFGLVGIYQFTDGVWSSMRLSDLGGSDINPSALVTSDGVLWVGGLAGNLHALRAGVWSIYTSDHLPLPTTRIVDLMEASDGALWMVGLGQSAVRLEYGPSTWETFEGLRYQGQAKDGALWFLEGDSAAVRGQGEVWTRYGAREVGIDRPGVVFAATNGDVWVGGSYDSVAAVARFHKEQWTEYRFPWLSWQVSAKSVYESRDGSVWFGAAGTIDPRRGQVGGVVQFRPASKGGSGEWIEHRPVSGPGPPTQYVYGTAQSADGRIWFGGVTGSVGLRFFDGQNWTVVTEPVAFTASAIDVLRASPDGGIWVGTRRYGAFYLNGGVWVQHDVKAGLPDNRVQDVWAAADGTVWVSTDAGLSRFDGVSWTADPLPGGLNGLIRTSQDGSVWVNNLSGDMQVIRYRPDRMPPETAITLSVDEVSQPGNTTIAWAGFDPWRSTGDPRMQFSWRLDGGAWSPYAADRNHVFQALLSGDHFFEVRARDTDFNVDTTPAQATFTVTPPVWAQPWFIISALVALSVIVWQAARLVLRDRMLQASNAALSNANEELFGLNQSLREKTQDLEAANVRILDQERWKAQFLKSMSHELRTPLNAILGFSSLVLRRAADVLPERQYQNLVKIRQGGEYLLTLVDDILDLTSIEAGNLQVQVSAVDVAQVVDSACDTVGSILKPGVELFHEVLPNTGPVRTDRARLRQILVNLLGYSAKHTSKGRIEVHADLQGEDLRITVKDSGPGISKEHLTALFADFRQVEGSGIAHRDTGLGMSVAKRLAELLGGGIAVTSEEGKGSIFTIRVLATYGQEGNA